MGSSVERGLLLLGGRSGTVIGIEKTRQKRGNSRGTRGLLHKKHSEELGSAGTILYSLTNVRLNTDF